jgi:hypothetical protein
LFQISQRKHRSAKDLACHPHLECVILINLSIFFSSLTSEIRTRDKLAPGSRFGIFCSRSVTQEFLRPWVDSLSSYSVKFLIDSSRMSTGVKCPQASRFPYLSVRSDGIGANLLLLERSRSWVPKTVAQHRDPQLQEISEGLFD